MWTVLASWYLSLHPPISRLFLTCLPFLDFHRSVYFPLGASYSSFGPSLDLFQPPCLHKEVIDFI